MSANSRREPSALERSERLIKKLEGDAARIASSTVARTQELAEDVWAEAKTLRKTPPKR